MKPRRLTVGYTPLASRARQPDYVGLPAMPFLRLQGRWLHQAGFTIGTPVRVAVAPGLLALEALDPDGNDERD